MLKKDQLIFLIKAKIPNIYIFQTKVYIFLAKFYYYYFFFYYIATDLFRASEKKKIYLLLLYLCESRTR